MRVIEYEYRDAQAMAEDMARWVHNSPPGNINTKFRSASMLMSTIFAEGEEDND